MEYQEIKKIIIADRYLSRAEVSRFLFLRLIRREGKRDRVDCVSKDNIQRGDFNFSLIEKNRESSSKSAKHAGR